MWHRGRGEHDCFPVEMSNFPSMPQGDSVCLHPGGSSHRTHSGCQLALIKKTKNHINDKQSQLQEAEKQELWEKQLEALASFVLI